MRAVAVESLPKTGKAHDLPVVSIQTGLTISDYGEPNALAKQTDMSSNEVQCHQASEYEVDTPPAPRPSIRLPLLRGRSWLRRCPPQGPVPTITGALRGPDRRRRPACWRSKMQCVGSPKFRNPEWVARSHSSCARGYSARLPLDRL